MGGCEAVSRALEGVRGESGLGCEAPSSAVWLNGEGVVRDGFWWGGGGGGARPQVG